MKRDLKKRHSKMFFFHLKAKNDKQQKKIGRSKKNANKSKKEKVDFILL